MNQRHEIPTQKRTDISAFLPDSIAFQVSGVERSDPRSMVLASTTTSSPTTRDSSTSCPSTPWHPRSRGARSSATSSSSGATTRRATSSTSTRTSSTASAASSGSDDPPGHAGVHRLPAVDARPALLAAPVRGWVRRPPLHRRRDPRGHRPRVRLQAPLHRLLPRRPARLGRVHRRRGLRRRRARPGRGRGAVSADARGRADQRLP